MLNRQKQLPALIREPGTMNGREYRHKQEKLSVIAGTWANGGWLGVNAVVVATKTDEMELDSVYITVVPTIFQGQ